MQRTIEYLRHTIEFVEQDLSLELRRCTPNALLNIAVARLIACEGRDGAAAILKGLAHAISSGAVLSVDRTTR